jgi:hypothetical protein
VRMVRTAPPVRTPLLPPSSASHESTLRSLCVPPVILGMIRACTTRLYHPICKSNFAKIPLLAPTDGPHVAFGGDASIPFPETEPA